MRDGSAWSSRLQDPFWLLAAQWARAGPRLATASAVASLGWCRGPGSHELRRHGPEGFEGAQESLGPGPVFSQVQRGAASGAGQVAGHRDETSAQRGQGDGACPFVELAEPGRPAGQVVGDGPERQPGRVGPKTPEGMCAQGPSFRSLITSSISAWRRWSASSSMALPSRSVTKGWYSYLAKRASWLPGVGFTRRTTKRTAAGQPLGQ